MKNGNYEFAVTVNIVPLHPLDMLCWWLATREIAHVGRIDGSRLGSRETKHGAFEILRGFYKSVLPYQGEEAVRAQLLADQVQARRRTDPVAESLPG